MPLLTVASHSLGSGPTFLAGSAPPASRAPVSKRPMIPVQRSFFMETFSRHEDKKQPVGQPSANRVNPWFLAALSAAAGGLFLGLQALDHDLVVQGYDFHAADTPSGDDESLTDPGRRTGATSRVLLLFRLPGVAVSPHQGPDHGIQDHVLADRLGDDA